MLFISIHTLFPLAESVNMNIECKHYARAKSLATVNSLQREPASLCAYRVRNERVLFKITLNYMPRATKGTSLGARIMHIIVHIYFNNKTIKLRISLKFSVSWEYN